MLQKLIYSILFLCLHNFLICTFFIFRIIFGRTCYVATVLCKGKILSSVLMGCAMGLHFGMQEEDIFEHIDVKCHLCTLLVNLQIIM
jgi:hypothetical protein